MQEFPVVVECKLCHIIELGLHTQFIGEVADVKAGPAVMATSGLLDIEKVKPLIFTPDTLAYYRVGPLVAQAFSIGRSI